MNIPENILQQVADAAFGNSQLAWGHASHARRAVIQHALDNPALAPWLNVPQAWPPVGEYTDAELMRAWNHREYRGGKMSTTRNLRAFLAALPRRESPALADAIARAEKTEKELAALKGDMLIAERAVDNVLKILPEMVKSPSWEDAAIAVREHIDKLQEELAALKSAQLGILRPIAEMPETVPEGCFMISGWQTSGKGWLMNIARHPGDTHFAILRLPAAEATPPAEVAIIEEQAWVDPVCGCIRSPDAPKDSPCPICKPAAQVPLGPEDVPPGSVLKALSWKEYEWRSVSHVYSEGILLDNCPTTHSWIELEANWQINTSIPDTGRWDANAWRPCSKPGK